MKADKLDRIEIKLDKIIRFFNIDQEPRRSNQDLDRQAERDAERILKRLGWKVVN